MRTGGAKASAGGLTEAAGVAGTAGVAGIAGAVGTFGALGAAGALGVVELEAVAGATGFTLVDSQPTNERARAARIIPRQNFRGFKSFIA